MTNPLIPWSFHARSLPDQQVPRYLVLGTSTEKTPEGESRYFTLERSDREGHMYISGLTGSGKSRFLENMIIQDVALNQPLCVIDPTGMLYSKTLDFLAHCVEQCRYSDHNPHGYMPREVESILARYLFLNLDDPTNPLCINPLEPNEDETTEMMVDDLLKLTERLFGSVDEMRRLRQTLRNLLWVIVELNRLPVDRRPSLPDDLSYPLNLSFTSHFLSLTGPERCELVRLLPDHEDNRYVKEFWLGFFARYESHQAQERLESTWNILQYFLGDSLVLRFFGCGRSTFRVAEVMRSGKSLFCYLPLGKNLKGSQLVGTYLATKFQHAAYRRSLEERKHPYYLYVDEFHEFADEQYAKAMTTLRQYGLRMINAHQSKKQPPFHTAEGSSILETIKGNSIIKVLFRLAREDAEVLAPELFELSQKKFHFRYAERTMSVGSQQGMVHTVSFQHASGRTLSWSRSTTETWSLGESFAIQSSKGTNIGETMTEGIGSTVAEGLAQTITESESRGITEVWSKQQGISLAIGDGWSHMVDHKLGFTHTQTDSESLSVTRGESESHAKGHQEGRTDSEGNNFTVTDTAGNNLVHTEGQSTAYHQQGVSKKSGSNRGTMSQTAKANSTQHGHAVQEIHSVTNTLSKSRGEGETRQDSMGLNLQKGFSEKHGLSGSRTVSDSEQEGHQRGAQDQLGTSKGEGKTLTLSEQQQQTLAQAFSTLKQVAQSMTETLQEAVAMAHSEGGGSSEQFTRGRSLGRSETLAETLSTGERIVFYSLEGERECDVNRLQRLPRRHCVVSKTALGAQEVQTLFVPDGYFSNWNEDVPSDILRRQRERWGPRTEEPEASPEQTPFPLVKEREPGDPFAF